MIELTKQQKKFHNIIIDWIHEFNNLKYRDNHYIVLGGVAGSGKTTILSTVLDTLNQKKLNIACATYTGKASQVLANKIQNQNIHSCSTIHRLIYRPKTDKEGKLLGFVLRSRLECDIIIIDECSMISLEIFNDLLKYKIPLIFIGDHKQLPPVGGKKFDIFEKTEIKLTEIHRQAENSPIIKMSKIVREGGDLKTGLFGLNCARMDWADERAQKALFTYKLNKDNIILCGTNKTRVALNLLIRETLGFTKKTPQKNEKIVCLQNNHVLQIMNGCLGYINSIKKVKNYAYKMAMKFDFCLNTNHFVYNDGFNQIKQDKYFEFILLNKNKIKEEKGNFDRMDLFDFGYALSVHKSQGSEFERVIVIAERTFYQSDEEYARWLYTAITRASKRLLIIDNF